MAYQDFANAHDKLRTLYNNIKATEEKIAKEQIKTQQIDENKLYYDDWIRKRKNIYNTEWEEVLGKAYVPFPLDYNSTYLTYYYGLGSSTWAMNIHYKEYEQVWEKFPIKYLPYIDYQVLFVDNSAFDPEYYGYAYEGYTDVLTNHIFITEELDPPVEDLKKVTMKIFWTAVRRWLPKTVIGNLSVKLVMSFHIPESII